jgi:hypothetical protein
MNIQDLIKKAKARLTPKEILPNDAVLGFLRVLEDVRQEELSCPEIFNRLDEYVEKEVDTKDAAHIMPLIREHLDMCPDCCEEYEAILDVLNENDKNIK